MQNSLEIAKMIAFWNSYSDSYGFCSRKPKSFPSTRLFLNIPMLYAIPTWVLSGISTWISSEVPIGNLSRATTKVRSEIYA